eukprot:gene17904-19682_t
MKKLLKDKTSCELIQGLGSEEKVADATFHDVERFVQTIMYSGMAKESYLQTRIRLYQRLKTKSSAAIPPDPKSLSEDIKRANLQSYVWLRSLNANFAEQIIVSGNAQFPNSSQYLNDYRRVIAEEISCTSCNRCIHWKYKRENSVNGDELECAVCINPLVLERDKHTAAVPVAQTSPVSIKEKNKCKLEPANAYKMRLMITTSETRAARCEQCKAPFNDKGIVRQRFIDGNYGPRPYVKKATGTWHKCTRNYYYCPRKKCSTKEKQDINGSDLDISFVKNDLN